MDLATRRLHAALSSGGTSDEVIYSTVERALSARGAGGSLLDFGAGRGILLRRLASAGRHPRLCGVDLYSRPEELPAEVEWIEADLNGPIPMADRGFDAIVSSEVVEHLENPRAVAREWFRLLRPGGFVIMTTPNNESLRALAALVLRGHFVFFGDADYPAHITALLRTDVERLLAEAGFCDIEVGFTDIGGIPKLPWVNWQRVAPWLRGVRFSDHLVASARRP